MVDVDAGVDIDVLNINI